MRHLLLFVLLAPSIVFAEAFPYCRFPDSGSKLLMHEQLGAIELNHPDGKAQPAYSLRNHPEYSDGSTAGPFLHLQYCQVEGIRDWLTAWIKETEGRIRLYRQLTGYVVPGSPIDHPAYDLYVNWRKHEPRLPFVYLWSQALDVSVHFSALYDLDMWEIAHNTVVYDLCQNIREKKNSLYMTYQYIAKTLHWELSHYELPAPFPEIPYSTWDGASWDTDPILMEDWRCPVILGEV